MARLALIPVLALAAFAVSTGPAAAHSGMTGSDPADGATVDVAPDAVSLTFNEAPQALGTEVAVVGPDGARVSEGVTTVADVTVTQALSATRPAGTYVIQWRVTSADGHPLSGELTFTASAGTGVQASVDEGSTHPEPEPIQETTAPSAENTAETAAPSGMDEEEISWQWGPTSIIALVAIAAAAGALVVVALRLRRRNFGTRGEDLEHGDR
ncbi:MULTISPECIES: copper resistance CopC family protein [unclassified Cellulomonas]|uniref:copper resistance CopC family protein n=1 Tax=unclassified Cellulomonas TaxID=2620175 RepID=UPI001C4EDAAA|nr:MULTISPECIES: copper resistance CopC family protein [unclassified Cellulomonas]MBW0254445.1 copper resistance protein CopC [Cellulomonas sp. PS-H5]MCG7284673.1 copper resistance protein CopC [Cellulomonas sp. ACRRI]